MNILIAIVHYWNPDGGGRHQSLRPNPQPRIDALEQQLLCLCRLGLNQSVLNMEDRAIYRTNDAYRNNIDIRIVTDGEHHVLDKVSPAFTDCFLEVVSKPANSRLLGFEAQKVLASCLSDKYDLYCFLEDDLLIHDPTFFQKLRWFTELIGNDSILLPHRVEFSSSPHRVNRFYIDGPIDKNDLRRLVPNDGPIRVVKWAGDNIPFIPPVNPHSGCFFLNYSQMSFWSHQSWWLDFDTSFISPLESAATLGIAKTFNLFKPCLSHAGWLEIQHYGTVFHELIGDSVS